MGEMSEGFLKASTDSASRLSSSDRVALVRRGNEFFNQGNLAVAKKIFVTCRYSDGLIRLAHKHLDQGESIEALRLYWIAGDRKSVSSLTEQMAIVIRGWLEEGT